MSFSQNNEEFYITEYFRDKLGRFIDIGAFHPFTFSNTRRLYELGWKGVFVEPAPSLFKLFEDEYGGNTDITLLNIAVGDTTDHVKFYESEGDAVSTTSEGHRIKWNVVAYKEIMVPMLETIAFFNQYGQDIDFISLDTEGTNMVIFRLIPDWVWQRLQLICIEHDGFYHEIKGKLVDFGFKELYSNAENIILGK
jgi:FkbM family methyltransferase